MDIVAYIMNDINKIQMAKESVTLNQSQAAKILGVSDSTLENWRKRSIGPQYIKIGKDGKQGRVMYPKIELAKWIANNLIKTA